MGHRFDPIHAGKLNNEERRKMLPPDKVLQYLDLKKEDTVLDLGAGTGYFSIPIAKLVKKVISVDVSEEMLDHLKQELEREKIDNIETILHEIETLPFNDRIADKVILSLVLHEVKDLNQTIREIRRVLHPKGKLLVIEWEKKISKSGPPIEERLESFQLKRVLEDNYFQVSLKRINPDQYLLIGELKKD
ncbi:class I SAM-dependent methyltransferase [Tepidibacillus fermentans]|uniref:Ubiquinone/menaquinone biosynthesis C-methylase UbiE n=1 Tax=Tepidibacillus fermentans TaxID=1281767 RepID=A0A4R3KJF8_9BACI|nr:class I SAM-dependent methyltransferase [Tepidibacillus fermentans]TCS83514.1 ubiquinone/menaquinone biosynthesis C-methylase UbiE [Tepidibacillus fermentans]